MTYIRKTKEDLQNEVKGIYEELEAGLDQLLNSEEYIRFLDTMAKRPKYSLANTILIYLQKPNATFIAGYRKFKDQYGHQVQKDQRGIKILAPIIYKRKKTKCIDIDDIDEDKSQKEKEDYLAGFRVVNVFDISQTEPIMIRNEKNEETISPKAEKLIESLSYLRLAEIWAEDEEYVETLLAAAKEVIDIPVMEKELPINTGGYFSYKNKDDLHIVLNQNFGVASRMSTLVHEWTHYTLHNPYNENSADITNQDKEIQAESVAYIVMKHFGIDTSCDTLKYIVSWSKSKEKKDIKKSIQIIQKTAAVLIDDLENRMSAKGYIITSQSIDKQAG